MSEQCSGSCSSCGQSCADRKEESLLAPANPLSSVKKVIAVVSGKGGVGKSTVTSMLAVEMQRRGHAAAVLDADITGPSIPKAFAIKDRPTGVEEGLLPCQSREGIQIMSVNLLLQNETDPVLWRGPILAGTVKQFWTEVCWKDVDYMFVDMPPGTGDVPLTVYQSLPIDGVIIVASPQDLVGMIVAKAVNMANMMHVPVLGFVENYSYLTCPDCGKRINVFGESHLDALAEEYGLPVLAKLPIDPKVAKACDEGLIEYANIDAISGAADAVEKL
jgi:Mrp family chromosome partitioning ATPase